MIKIASLLNAQSELARKTARDMQPINQERAQADGLAVVIAPYPSKKLTLKDGRYIATDHEK